MLKYRPYTDDDYNFIVNSYLKSNRNSGNNKYTSNDVYYKYQKIVINSLIHNSQIVVCCEEDYDYHILGYIIYDKHIDTIHYVYVKSALRRNGIMTSLVEQTSITNGFYTHYSNVINCMKLDDFLFNPYLLKV